MEGAVRSGYLAAQGIMSVLDKPTRLIRPGLKPGLLAGWLFGTGDSRPARPAASPSAIPPADKSGSSSALSREEGVPISGP